MFLLLYITNYIVIRQSNLQVLADYDCPANCSYVSFPYDGFNILYSPLIIIDKQLTGTNFYIIEK
jgi:hypothetical protein